MKVNKKVIVSIISIICIIVIFSTFSYALDTEKYADIYNGNGETDSINEVSGYALGLVQVIGMSVAVIGIIILGIKYMLSSPDEKATIKDKAVIYIIGAVIIFGASGLIGLIGEWAHDYFK